MTTPVVGSARGRAREGRVLFSGTGLAGGRHGPRLRRVRAGCAAAVFEDADRAVGYDLTELCFEGPIERLSETEITQPALVTATLACLAAVAESPLRPDFVIGHSVGEYAALVASGALDGPAAVRLVRERGIATAAAAAEQPGAMAAVIGLDDEVVERLCDEIDGVWAANYNSPGQVVVSGTEDGVARADGVGRGGRRSACDPPQGLRRLPQPAHRDGRAAAARSGRRRSRSASRRSPFFSTVSCGLEHADAIPRLLVEQLTAPVRFTQIGRVPARPRRGHVRRDRPRIGAVGARPPDRP